MMVWFPRRAARVGLILLGAAVVFGAVAPASACPRFPAPRVRVDVQFNPPKLDYGRSIAQIEALPAGRGPSSAGNAGSHILGLYDAKIASSFTVNMQILPQQDKSLCGAPSDITVTVTIPERTIYVARELPNATCIHREVLRHEQKHAAVDEAIIREYASTLRRRMAEVGGRVTGVRRHSQADLQKAISETLQKTMDAEFQRMTRDRERQQDQVDSPQEYARVSASCNGELRLYLDRAKGRF